MKIRHRLRIKTSAIHPDYRERLSARTGRSTPTYPVDSIRLSSRPNKRQRSAPEGFRRFTIH